MGEPSVDSPKGDWDPPAAEEYVEAVLGQVRELNIRRHYAEAVEALETSLKGLERPRGQEAQNLHLTAFSILSAKVHRELGLAHRQLAPVERDQELAAIPSDLLGGYPDELAQGIIQVFREYRDEKYLHHLNQYVHNLGESASEFSSAWIYLGNAELPDGRAHENDFSKLPLERRDAICRERMPLVVMAIEGELAAAEAARFRLSEMEAAGCGMNAPGWTNASRQPCDFARRALTDIDRHRDWVTMKTGFNTSLTEEEEEQLATLEARAQLAFGEGCALLTSRNFDEDVWEEAAKAIDGIDESLLSDEERERLEALQRNSRMVPPSMVINPT